MGETHGKFAEPTAQRRVRPSAQHGTERANLISRSEVVPYSLVEAEAVGSQVASLLALKAEAVRSKVVSCSLLEAELSALA